MYKYVFIFSQIILLKFNFTCYNYNNSCCWQIRALAHSSQLVPRPLCMLGLVQGQSSHTFPLPLLFKRTQTGARANFKKEFGLFMVCCEPKKDALRRATSRHFRTNFGLLAPVLCKSEPEPIIYIVLSKLYDSLLQNSLNYFGRCKIIGFGTDLLPKPM